MGRGDPDSWRALGFPSSGWFSLYFPGVTPRHPCVCGAAHVARELQTGSQALVCVFVVQDTEKAEAKGMHEAELCSSGRRGVHVPLWRQMRRSELFWQLKALKLSRRNHCLCFPCGKEDVSDGW